MITQLFYMFGALLATLFAYLATQIRLNWGSREKQELNRFFLANSFLVLFFFLAFTSSSGDLPNYVELFEQSNDFSRYFPYYLQRLRPTYFAFNALVRLLTDNFWVFSAIWAFVILFLVYKTLYRLRKEISFPWAIFAFASMYLYHGISARRFYLALAVVIYGAYYLLRKKNGKFLICIAIAASIHLSAACMLVFWLASIVFHSRLFSKHRGFVLSIFICGAIILVATAPLWIGFINQLDYGEYGIKYSKIGFGYLLYWLPPLLAFVFSSKYLADPDLKQAFFIIICCTMLVSLIGYVGDGMARTNELLCYVNIIFIPYTFRQIRDSGKALSLSERWEASRLLFIMKICFLALVLYQFFAFFSGIAYTSGLVPYQNIFGWYI